MEEVKQDEKKTEEEQRYEDEVEINDFPQTARWKVTSKVGSLTVNQNRFRDIVPGLLWFRLLSIVEPTCLFIFLFFP